MKFIFNDSLSIDSNLFKTEDKLESVIITSGLILEKNLRLAQVSDADFQDMVDRYNRGGAKDKADILSNEFGKLNDTQKQDFSTRVSKGKDGRTGNFDSISGESPVEKAVSKTMEVADLTGEAASKASAILMSRSKIISQLRGFGLSENEIGELFDSIFTKSFNESELLQLIDDAISYATQARTSLKTVLNFMINHYEFQRDFDLTRTIAKQAAEVRAENPDVDIFEMLSISAAGGTPQVSQVSLIDDPTMRDTVLRLINVSQMRVVEQNEAIRRELQKSRDNLQSMQEQTNLQRALVDAMNKIVSNKVLTQQIDEFGKLFKKYMSDPYFRALRDILYDLSAAKTLVGTWTTLVSDTQPITPRSSDFEMRGRPLGQSELTSQGKDRDERNIGNANLQSLNSALPKFYKLAQTSDNLTADQQNAINRMCDIKISLYQKYYKMAYQMGATMVAEYLKFSIPYIEKSKKSLNLIGNLFNVIDNDFENYVKNAKFSSNRNNRFVYSQSQVQTSPSATPIDQAARSYTEKLDNGLFTFLDLNKNFELSQGNLQAFREGGIVFKTLISNWERQKVLNETGKGLPAPTQLKPSLRRAVVAENEMYVDTLAGLTRDESFVRTNLAKKRGSYKETYQQKKESLDRAQRMDVDLGEGQDGQTPNETPAKIKSMYEDLAKWLSDVVKNIRYERDLLKRSFDRMINERDPNKALDPSAKMQIEKALTEIQNDLKYFENEYGKYASTALIATEMARKQRFLQKIGPIQKKIAAMIKGGFSPVGLMFNYSQADAGGDSQSYGQLLYSILNEEKKALGILRNAYIEARQSTTPVDLSTYLGITGTNSTGEVEIR